VIVPALLYALWYLGYGESQITENGLINAPGFAEDLVAAAFGGLVGRALEWGRPLALLGALLVLRRLARPVPVSPRLAGLLATGLGLWAITAVARSTISQPEASRYIYLGAVVIVLVGVELLRGIPITSRVTALAACVVGFCAITGLTVLRAGSMDLRSTSKTVAADLGALELAAAYAPPGYQPDPQGAPQITAGPYLHTVRAIGSTPADSPTDLAAAEPSARAAADGVLLALEAPRLHPLGTARPAPLASLSITSLIRATQSRRGGCLQLTPLIGGSMVADLALPSGGVVILNEGPAPAALALRRFGETFYPIPSQVTPRSAWVLSLPLDRAPVAWQLQLASTSRLSICGQPS
jgi:hypothetical protein